MADIQIQELQDRVAALEVALGKRTRATAQNPEYVTLAEAASLYGLSVQGVQNRLKREGRKPNGFEVRRMWGRVHLADWRRYMESKIRRSPRAVARQALRKARDGQ